MKINDLQKINNIKELQSFADWVCARLKIITKPKINFSNDLKLVEVHRTFGSTKPNGDIWTYVGDRIPADIMRTLCHELVHYKQFELGLASKVMNSEQKQRIEDVANAMAGRLMRKYGKKHVEIYS